MENKRRASRFIRVLWLILAVWPFANLGGYTERSHQISRAIPTIATCQASALVGDGGVSLNGSRGYDSSGRCVVGGDGCGSENSF